MNQAIIPIGPCGAGLLSGTLRATKDHRVVQITYPPTGHVLPAYSGRVKPNPKNNQELILELWWSGDNDYIIANVYLNVQMGTYRVVSNVAVSLPDLNMVVEYNFVKGKN